MQFLKSIAWTATLAALLETVLGAERGDKVIVLPLKHRVVEPHLKKRQSTDTERLFNDNLISYHIEIGIGTPPQLFNMTLDTGSPFLWVPSTACPDTQCPVKKFDSAASSTFNQTDLPFSASYVVGHANGTYARETVSVGSLTVTNQMIGLVSDSQDVYYQSSVSPASGILGLSFPGLYDPPFPFNLVQQNLISQPIFSIFLNSQYDDGYSGEIMFGGIDSTKYQGNISYFTVYPTIIPISTTEVAKTYVYWAIPGSGISTTTGYSAQFTSLQIMMLDTGSTFSFGPASVVNDVIANITDTVFVDFASGYYAVSCSLRKSTDYVVFHIEASPSEITLNPTKVAIPVSQLILQEDTTGQYCAFGIQPITGTGAASYDWILGQSFLRSVYAVHDMANMRVGLASVSGLGIVTLGEVTKASVTPSIPNRPTATGSSGSDGEGKAVSLNPLAATQSIAVMIVSLLLLAL